MDAASSIILRLIRLVKIFLKHTYFNFFRKTCTSNDGSYIIASSLNGLLTPTFDIDLCKVTVKNAPFNNLGIDIKRIATTSATSFPAIFITGRFRSGTTLLWNIFRHVSSCTAYYEPLNEACWQQSRRWGTQTDPSHIGASNYWQEYEATRHVSDCYKKEWAYSCLYMDKTHWNPEMLRYLTTLIGNASGRPVLQCNRIDLRLGWMRFHFPRAKIIHIYRHPRDQWISSLRGDMSLPLDAKMAEFMNFDKFYLIEWMNDLKKIFPFLGNTFVHPYEVFYYLWKLSYIFGKTYSDYSISLEHLSAEPRTAIHDIFNLVGLIDEINITELVELVVVPTSGKWVNYAPIGWFQEIESRCEENLEIFFRSARFI